MADPRTSNLNLYEIGAASDNVGVHMITHYNFNISQLDSWIGAHDVSSITIASGTLTITATDGTTYTASVDADDMNYSNSTSGLSATQVQAAIDEIVTAMASKADAATTLAGYGITDAYTKTETDAKIEALDYSDTAVSGSYVTEVDETDGVISVTREAADASPTDSSTKMVTSGGVKTALDAKQDTLTAGDGIDITSDVVSVDAEEKTATSTFSTVNGGLLSSCVVTLEPVQDLHGYDSPWAGGARKNLLPISFTNQTLDGIQWSKILDNDNNVLGVNANGQVTAGRPYSLFKVGEVTLPAGNYKINGSPNNSSGVTWRMMYKIGSEDYQSVVSDQSLNLSETSLISVYCQITSGAGQVTNKIFYPMIRLASETDATFEPYSNICPISGHTTATVELTDGNDTDTYSTALNQTVYGGTVDLVSGEMVCDKVVDTYIWGDGTNEADRGNNISSKKFILSQSALNKEASNKGDYTNLTKVQKYDTSGNVHFYISASNDALVFLPNTTDNAQSVQICYALATPVTVQLSKQQIKALIGSNTITAPLTGQSVSATYREVMGYDSVEQSIEIKVSLSSLGTVEDSNLSSQAYSSGDYFVRNGQMCKATAAIAQDATLTEGTNYTAYTLADILKLIENA